MDPLQQSEVVATAEVLAQVDAVTQRPFVDLVVDEAGQKRTGSWTVQSALALGVPVTVIAATSTTARALATWPPRLLFTPRGWPAALG